MLRSRIIPCLLVRNGGLVKTRHFKDPKYVGDPLNAVRIFNEKEADELIVLDIDATAQGRDPDYKTIANWAAECRMPLCYGGGIKTVDQANRISSLGVEKIAISSAAVEKPGLVRAIATQIGSQSVVVVLDVKRRTGVEYDVYTHNGTRNTKLSPFDLARKVEELGAGEVVVNSIDNDGAMQGYDMPLVDRMRASIRIPVTALGGAGSLGDIEALITRFGIVGAAAGSLFVFKGQYRAVLINYPNRTERDLLHRGRAG